MVTLKLVEVVARTCTSIADHILGTESSRLDPKTIFEGIGLTWYRIAWS